MKEHPIGSPEMSALSAILRKIDFFTPLTVGQLERVLPSIMLFEYAKGETIFKQGVPGDAFYIVHRGTVDIKLTRWFILSQKLATLGAGAFFGEIALISDLPRSASAVCAEPTMLFTLMADAFKFVLHENPSAADEMSRIAARRTFATSHIAAS